MVSKTDKEYDKLESDFIHKTNRYPDLNEQNTLRDLAHERVIDGRYKSALSGVYSEMVGAPPPEPENISKKTRELQESLKKREAKKSGKQTPPPKPDTKTNKKKQTKTPKKAEKKQTSNGVMYGPQPGGIPKKGTNGKVFYNPRTGEYYVPHLSKKRPSNGKEFFDVTGTSEAVKGRAIESEKYNKRKKRHKAGKKASRTRKKNEFKESAGGKIEWLGSGAKKVGGAAKSAGGYIKDKSVGAGKFAKKQGGIQWRSHKKRNWRRKDEAHPEYTHPGGMRGALQRTGRTVGNFGYALPGPFQVFTLAWRKMTKALKALIIIVFAVVLLFVPWGVFYYSGWAVGASVMFLFSLIYWVFISLFNGIASILVALINGVARIIMSAFIAAVEWVTGALLGDSTWNEGMTLMNKALIQYDQFAEVPELMKVIEPTWQSWMNNTIMHQILFEIFKVDYPLTWISQPISDFYAGLDATQSMMVGVGLIAVPVVILIVVWWKNRHHLG